MEFTCEILHQPVFSCIHRRAPYLAASWEHVKWVFSPRETFKIILQQKSYNINIKNIYQLNYFRIARFHFIRSYSSTEWERVRAAMKIKNVQCYLQTGTVFSAFRARMNEKKAETTTEKKEKLKRRRFYHSFVNITWHQTKWISAPTNGKL